MKQLCLTGLEAAINRYLSLDPHTVERIADLHGKVIKVEITDWVVHFYCLPQREGIQLTETCFATPDAIIQGKLLSLTRTGLNAGNTEASIKEQVTISGDIELGKKIQDILKNLDIDWEEHLSRVVGDRLAVGMMRSLRGLRDGLKQTVSTLFEKTHDYLWHESNLLPSADELEQFGTDVYRLRDDVERAEARLRQLQQREKH